MARCVFEGKKARDSEELRLGTLLEHCMLLLLGGSLHTSKEAINKNLDFN